MVSIVMQHLDAAIMCNGCKKCRKRGALTGMMCTSAGKHTPANVQCSLPLRLMGIATQPKSNMDCLTPLVYTQLLVMHACMPCATNNALVPGGTTTPTAGRIAPLQQSNAADMHTIIHRNSQSPTAIYNLPNFSPTAGSCCPNHHSVGSSWLCFLAKDT